MPNKHAGSLNDDCRAGFAVLIALPELLPKVVPAGHRLMFSQASNATRQMTQEIRPEITIKITPSATSNFLESFANMTAIFTVLIKDGVRYSDLIWVQRGSMAQLTLFLECIARVEFSKLSLQEVLQIVAGCKMYISFSPEIVRLWRGRGSFGEAGRGASTVLKPFYSGSRAEHCGAHWGRKAWRRAVAMSQLRHLNLSATTSREWDGKPC